jgi:hypothetical protein
LDDTPNSPIAEVDGEPAGGSDLLHPSKVETLGLTVL